MKYRKTYWQKSPDDELYDNTSKDVVSDAHMTRKQGRRANERRIGKVIEKVGIWRKLFSKYSHMNLDIAAERVGICKKTLDDYMMQIRSIL